MSTRNQSERDSKPSTSAPDAAAMKTPSEVKRELTDDEISGVVGGSLSHTVAPTAVAPFQRHATL
jgi:hypothetical protein